VPRLRRAYHECRYGQLHLHNAIPGGGGFDELTSVICLHGPGETGRIFMPLLLALGQARSVYALDLPGAGESDPAPGETIIDAAARAVTDFVDSMRIRQFDLVVPGALAPAAQELLEERGQAVRRIVVMGGDGLRGGSKYLLLSAAEVASPQFPARLVDLLADTP
jgi:pyruvate dehydrogenase E2 component (dihydrolipoamide acetyltransferase)